MTGSEPEATQSPSPFISLSRMRGNGRRKKTFFSGLATKRGKGLPLEKKGTFVDALKIPPKNVATKFEGEGVTLVATPLKRLLFYASIKKCVYNFLA